MAAELVRLNSTGTKKNGKKTGYFKTTKLDKKKLAGKKFRIKCFDPRAWNEQAGRLGMHVDFEEGKIK